MPNQNQFFSEAGTYTIDQVIKGQTPLAFYDPLAQVAYQPEVRRNANGKIGAVLPYQDAGLEGLFSQLQATLGSGQKTVKARKFYWAEYDQFQTFAFAVNKSNAAVPSGGVGVTVQISRASLTQNGSFAKPIAGFKAIVKELDQQVVNITNVTELPNGGFNVTLTPINGEVLDLTKRGQYTIVMASMRAFDLQNTPSRIQTQGMVKNPPALYGSSVQKFELGYAVDESEVDNYVYDKDIMIAKGLNSRGQEVEYYYIPQLTQELESMIVQNRTWNTLFNQYNATKDEDFDGVIPTIRKYGLFNYAYDQFLGGSFKSLLFSIIKSLRKINGSNEYMLIHDFNFGIDWGEAMKDVVRNSDQNYQYRLFGEGGTGIRDFEYFQFGNFKWSNYQFLTYQMDMFDSYRYGRPLEYFAMLMPARAFTDTDGNRVPILNYVNIQGAEMARDRYCWIDDARVRGERVINAFAKDSFGIEIHKPTQLGMIWRGNSPT
jgi:hypothetical protein